MMSSVQNTRILMTRSSTLRPGLFAGAALIGVLMLAACHKPAPVATETPPRAVRVARVVNEPLASALTVSGILTSREEAAVTSELSGYKVSKVFVEQGDWVKAGQPLAQLDDLKTRQARLTLRAPVSGLVLARNVRPGDLPAGSASGQPLFRMARDGLIEIDAEVPESDLAKLKPGQKAEVALPSGAKVTGTVRLISPEVDQTTKLGRARILLPVRPDLRPGGYAYARLPGVKSNGLVAPDRSVSYDADGAAVYVVDPSNRVHRVAVRTGERAGGFVELLQGPPAGSRVLVSGSSFVLDGDKVAPVESPPGEGQSPGGTS